MNIDGVIGTKDGIERHRNVGEGAFRRYCSVCLPDALTDWRREIDRGQLRPLAPHNRRSEYGRDGRERRVARPASHPERECLGLSGPRSRRAQLRSLQNVHACGRPWEPPRRCADRTPPGLWYVSPWQRPLRTRRWTVVATNPVQEAAVIRRAGCMYRTRPSPSSLRRRAEIPRLAPRRYELASGVPMSMPPMPGVAYSSSSALRFCPPPAVGATKTETSVEAPSAPGAR